MPARTILKSVDRKHNMINESFHELEILSAQKTWEALGIRIVTKRMRNEPYEFKLYRLPSNMYLGTRRTLKDAIKFAKLCTRKDTEK